MHQTNSELDLVRRRLLVASAGSCLFLSTGLAAGTGQVDGRHGPDGRGVPGKSRSRHLGLAEAVVIQERLAKIPEWLDRHLDLRPFDSISIEAIDYLSQRSYPACSVDAVGPTQGILDAILQLDVVNLRFGKGFESSHWEDWSPRNDPDVLPLVLEFAGVDIITPAAAGYIAGTEHLAVFASGFDGLSLASARALARFGGSLHFQSSQATALPVAQALSQHEGEALYIHTINQPADDVVAVIRSRRIKSFRLDRLENTEVGYRWMLAWEPTSAFVAAQHRKRTMLMNAVDEATKL